MLQGKKSPIRWLETSTTPRTTAARAELSTANNIPSMNSTQGDTSNRDGNLLHSPIAKTSFLPAEVTTSRLYAERSANLKAASTAANVDVNKGFTQHSSSFSENTVKRIIASPRKVQTQIAKISYKSLQDDRTIHSAHRSQVPVTTLVSRLNLGTTTTNPQISSPKSCSSHFAESPPTSGTVEFSKRKQERDEEICEIVQMLNEIQNDTILLKEIGESVVGTQKTVEDKTKSPNKDLPINNIATVAILDEPAPTPPPIPQATPAARTPSVAGNLDQIRQNLERPSTMNTKFERSKTDLHSPHVKAATTRRNRNPIREDIQTKKRSKSTQPPATQSDELLPEHMHRKPPAYDREAARQYMEEQRKKRRSVSAVNELTNRSNRAEKEVIKKRLEELSKHSKKLVTKNLKYAQKRTTTSTLNGVSPTKTARLDMVFMRPAERKMLNKNKNALVKTTAKSNSTKTILTTGGNIAVENATEAGALLVNPQTETSKTKAPPPALLENQKRIGLLRKPEIKDHSFSAIKDFSFDKENVAIEMMTPKLESARIKNKLSGAFKMEETPLVTKSIVEESKNEGPDLKLDIPSARLRPRAQTRDMSVQVHETASLMATKLKDSKDIDKAEISALPAEKININNNKECANIAETHMETQLAPSETSLMPAAAEKQNANADAFPSYWLKPSAVQIYPYNFIMAVRRKLEAITNPIHAQTNENTTANEENKAVTIANREVENNVETPLSSISKKYAVDEQSIVKKKLIPSLRQDRSEKSFATHTIVSNKIPSNKLSCKVEPTSQQTQENLLKSQSLTDMTSNFSSISLQLPVSNTVSEVSSLKSECYHFTVPKEKSKHLATVPSYSAARASEDDDTTMSSSIFNSPEKKCSQKQTIDFEFLAPRPVSPLSLEHVDNLKIKTRSKLKDAIKSKHIITERGGTAFNSRLNTKQKITSDEEAQAEAVSINFNRLLDDFNRSLSQVIEVNEQLKSTLDKSQKICAERIKRQNSKSESKNGTDEYSSDFEATSGKLAKIKSANSDENDLKQRTLEMEKSLHQRKKELFEITNAVKPLLSGSRTPSKSVLKSDMGSNLDLNLESVEISSANSSATKTILSEQSFADSTSIQFHAGEELLSSPHSEDSLDKRLHNIEQLKLNLKQSTLNSKANREQIDAKSKESNDEDNEKIKNQNIIKYSPESQNSAEQKNQKVIKTEIISSKGNTDGKFQISKSPQFHSSSKINIKKTNELNYLTSDASQQQTMHAMVLRNTMDSICSPSKSAKENTFLIFSRAQSAETTPTRKYSDIESQSIKEELQHYAAESPNQENDNQLSENTSQQYEKNCSPQKPSKTLNSCTSQSTSSKSQNDVYTKFQTKSDRDVIPSVSNNLINDLHTKEFSPGVKERPSSPQSSCIGEDGDFMQNSSLDSAAPPSYNASPSKHRRSAEKVKNASKSKTSIHNAPALGKKLVAIFNQSDLELSIVSSQNGNLSETSLNYSSVGVYERLIKNETTKSEHLTALLKMREKALIDRTKGQIAWLEVQKERYKAKGLLLHISAIKKKQRGILLKMEREREEIKRLLQSTTSTTTTSTHSSAQQQAAELQTPRKRFERGATISHPSTAPPVLPPLPLLPKSARSLSAHIHRQDQLQQTVGKKIHSAPIVRANYDLETNRSLEELLRKRENDLRKRREHVERLMQWHQRLDQEEAEVLQLEHMLLSCNNVPALPQRHHDCSTTTKGQTQISKNKQLGPASSAVAAKHSEQASQSIRRSAKREEKMERRLKEIDKSLRELSSISTGNNSGNATTTTTNTSTSDENSNNGSDSDFVRTTGTKLNKLWRRLTSQQVEKFESNSRYKLCKADLERLYEEAKIVVLRDFAQDEERVAAELLDKTATTLSCNQSQLELTHIETVTIPQLNLNFSSGQSEQEDGQPLEFDEQDVLPGESMVQKIADFTQNTLLPQIQPAKIRSRATDGYFETHIEKGIEEEEISSKPSTNSIPPNSYTSSLSTSFDGGSIDIPVESVEEEREEVIQRNVQKFLALTQRFNGTQHCEGLERSLSDTQLADNGVGPKKSTKNVANTTQRNIAYYGVKTQKKPSKTVNTEIANSLSSASSIFSSGGVNTMNHPEIVSIQPVAAENTARNNSVSSLIPSNQCSAINTKSLSLILPSEVINDIPALSKTTIATNTDSAKTELMSADSLPMSNVISSQAMSKTFSQSKIEKSIDTIYTRAESKSVSPLSSAPSSNSKSSNFSAAENLSASELSSDKRHTPSYNSVSKSIFSAQHNKTADVNSTAREISAKLEEISAAVSMLSHSNSLQSGTNSMSSHCHQQQQQSTKATPTVFSSPSISSGSFDAKAENNLHSADVVSSPSSYSSNFENIETEIQSPSGCTLKSNTASTLTQIIAYSEGTTVKHAQQSEEKNLVIDKYETDFEDENETRIDDISLPQFETTLETTQDDLDEDLADAEKEDSVSLPSSPLPPPPPISGEKVYTPAKNQVKKIFVDRESLPPPPPPPPLTPAPSPSSASSQLQVVASTSKESAATSTLAAANNKSSQHEQQQQTSPDVINELELRRYQQIQQYEHVTAVPYMYMREIPNKPPPPYVPPAHGSPMTTIFPSEERIKDITYRRTHELYCKILKTEYTNERGEKLPSVTEEKITNIYERIILDICREYLEEHKEVLTKSEPTTFYSNLAFFNPPDRLSCIQTFVYKEVRRCLAMDKTQPKRKQIYSVYGQRAKRDHIGKIIIQEMYDEDDKWCNFHREENEVLDLIIEEMLSNLIKCLAKDVLLEEGGIVENEEEEKEGEELIQDTVHKMETQQLEQKEKTMLPSHLAESQHSVDGDRTNYSDVDVATTEVSNAASDVSNSVVEPTEELAENLAATTKQLTKFKSAAAE